MSTLFGFSGRMGRLAYLGYSILIWIIACAFIGIGLNMIWTGSQYMAGMVILVAATIGLMWSSYALWFKRLHDIGLSGGYAILLVLIGIIGSLMYSESRNPNVADIGLILDWLSIIASLSCFFIPGTKGANKFG